MSIVTTPVRLAWTESQARDVKGVYRRLLAGPEHLREFLENVDRHGGIMAVDIETAGLGADAWTIKVVGMATGELGLALDPRDPASRDAIARAFSHASTIVFHNSAYDVPPLVQRGIMPASCIEKVWDTLVLVRMAEPDTMVDKKLEACVVRYLGGVKATAADTKRTMDIRYGMLGVRNSRDYFRKADINIPSYLRDNIMDAIYTAQLVPVLYAAAKARLEYGHPFTDYGVFGPDADTLVEREQRVNRVMLRRSAKGLRVDRAFLEDFRDRHEVDLERMADELTGHGIKPGNGAHLTTWLADHGHLPADWPRTAKTNKPSAKAEDLETLDHPMVRTFLSWKEQDKVRGYLETIDAMEEITGRIHPQVSVLGASATGRMAYSTPPLQQFPGAARGILLADEGDTMVSIDFTSVEPYVIACLARDEGLSAFYEGGGDIYAPIVEMAGVTRKVAKVVVLAALYGQGIKSLARNLGVDQTEAARIRAAVMSAMPGVARFIDRTKAVADRHGLVVTLSGRILPVPSFQGRVAAYKGVNYEVQGGAYDVLADTIIRVEEAGLGDAVYLALHDELVVSKDAAHDIRQIMETPPERLHLWAGKPTRLRTDTAELGDRWAAA